MIGFIAFVGGVFLGWNFPQPEYAKKIQAKIAETVKGWIK